MPYAIGTLVPWEGPGSYDSGDYHATFERCLAAIGWTDRHAYQGRTIEGYRHGIGLACHVESGAAGRECARVTVMEHGTVALHVGSSAAGQGIATSFAQICADALLLPLDRVTVAHGSTTLLEDGVGTFHGRSLAIGGSAVLNAASNLLDKLRMAASRRFGCTAEAVSVEDGRVWAGEHSASLAEFTGLAAAGVFANKGPTYSCGTHAAHVAVDVETGRVRLVAYAAVDDVGRMVNPLIVHGQKHGAIVQGIGGALLEHLAYDGNGQLLAGSLTDYALPRADDVPSLDVAVLELCRSPGNALGAKGAGEDAIGPVGAAIGNAVAAALADLGAQPRALPLTPQRVRALIAPG